MFQYARKVFQSCFSKYPLATNCVLYGSLSGGAELSQQVVINTRSKEVSSSDNSKETGDGYNLTTVGHYTALGGGVFAPVCHYWYQWLDRRLPGTAAAVVARKVAVDIALFALPYYTLFYIAINSMAKVPLEHSVTELKQKLVPTIATTTAFWVPAQAVNFRFVSPRFRVIYLAGCTFVEFNILALFKRLQF